MALEQPDTLQPASNQVQTEQASQPTTTNHSPPLPPAHLFDILPPLHELLARIEHTSTTSTDLDPTDLGARYTDSTRSPLDPKDLPKEILPLKAQIRRALRELEKLPDMDRSVQEQEEEIVELEGKMRRQEGMMRELGETGREVRGRVGGG